MMGFEELFPRYTSLRLGQIRDHSSYADAHVLKDSLCKEQARRKVSAEGGWGRACGRLAEDREVWQSKQAAACSLGPSAQSRPAIRHISPEPKKGSTSRGIFHREKSVESSEILYTFTWESVPPNSVPRTALDRKASSFDPPSHLQLFHLSLS